MAATQKIKLQALRTAPDQRLKRYSPTSTGCWGTVAPGAAKTIGAAVPVLAMAFEAPTKEAHIMDSQSINMTEHQYNCLPQNVRQQMREKLIGLLNELEVPFEIDPATGEVNAPLEKVADALGVPLSEATEMLFGRAN